MLDALLNNSAVDLLKTVLIFLFAITVLVAVHEFGHFWMARRCGVKVHRFSIGFGKTLYKRLDKHGTEFVIAMIPLGGYVKMLDGRAEKVAIDMQSQAFNHKSIAQRTAIVLAGPVANFIFAALLYWFVLMVGQISVKPVVGHIQANSIAEKAGIVSNMELKSIAGIEVKDWSAAQSIFLKYKGKNNVDVEVALSPGSIITETKKIDLSDWTFVKNKQLPLHTLGIQLPSTELSFNLVSDNSAAQEAGLKTGDKLITVSGQKINRTTDFVKLVQNSPQQPLSFLVERAGDKLTITLTPRAITHVVDGTEKTIGSIGVTIGQNFSEELLVYVQYGPIDAIYPAIDRTWSLMKLVAGELGKFIIGEKELKSLGGPGSIAKEARSSADGGGVSYLMFLILISINLGVINLFPLPVLDGGHLMFLAIEKVTGKPVAERVLVISFQVGAFLLILLMGLTFFN